MEVNTSVPTWAQTQVGVSMLRDTRLEIDGTIEELLGYLHGAASDLVKEILALQGHVDRAELRF